LKKKKSYIKVVAILFLGMATAFLLSCKKKPQDCGCPPSIVTQPLPAVVSFSTNIVPIFTNYCSSSGCHSALSPASGLNLTATSAYGSLMAKHETYTVNPSGSNLYIEVTNGNMPKPPATSLSSYEQQLILKWITQGAINN
jgi:hypothetical protein